MGYGAHPDDATCTDDLLKAGEAPLDPSAPVGGLFDSRHADGVEAMDAAQAHMPVTAALLDELTRERTCMAYALRSV